MTLIEMMVSMSIFSAMLLVAFTVTERSSSAFRTGAVVTQVQSEGQRCLQRIANRIQTTSADLITPHLSEPFSASSVEFQQPVGFDGTQVIWNVAESLSFELDALELDDGIDNDGDGLIDEGRVVWTERAGDPGSRRVFWVSNVRRYLEGELPNNLDDNGNGLIDEAGLAITVEGSLVTIWLSLERVETGDRTQIQTGQTSIRLRN